MRKLFFFVGGCLSLLLWCENFGYGEPLTEVKTKTIKITDVSPKSSQQHLMDLMKKALEDAAKTEKDEALKNKMLDISRDKETLENQAAGVKEDFGKGAKAFSIPFLPVPPAGTGVLIILIDLQLLPPNATEVLKDHEDGHSLIHSELAKKLGPKIAAKHKNDKKDKGMNIAKELLEALDDADKKYEGLTHGGNDPDQDQEEEARKVIEKVLKDYDTPALVGNMANLATSWGEIRNRTQ